MIIHPESLYIHGFNLIAQFGPKRLGLLLNAFPDSKTAYFASKTELMGCGLEENLVDLFFEHKNTLDLEVEAKLLEKHSIGMISISDEQFPMLLKEIPQVPPLLYYRGTLPTKDQLCLAVVGTRKISGYGRIVLPTIVEPLINQGMTIVSGLAYGIDTASHQLAITKQRPTIAVLGCGLDDRSLYPQDHVLLANQIIETGGCLISEHPIGRPALKQNFVARNRIISGLSIGTLVVECGLKSGALITARYALDQNRSVYAVPGPIYNDTSGGPNNLIKLGAKLVTEANDILSDLNLAETSGEFESADLSGQERLVAEQINFEGVATDILIRTTKLDASTLGSILTMLEMKGVVRNTGNGQYALTKRIK